jgi:hypothetical protein
VVYFLCDYGVHLRNFNKKSLRSYRRNENVSLRKREGHKPHKTFESQKRKKKKKKKKIIKVNIV